MASTRTPIRCWLGFHRFEIQSALPHSSHFDEVTIWIREDYDLYRVCARCGLRVGVGARYE